MADLATPSAADMSTSSTTPTASKTKTSVVKPEKPDEEQYKKDLARAEREHGASQDTLVCDNPRMLHLYAGHHSYGSRPTISCFERY